MKKKIWMTAALSVCAVLAVAACGKKDSGETTVSQEAETKASAEETSGEAAEAAADEKAENEDPNSMWKKAPEKDIDEALAKEIGFTLDAFCEANTLEQLMDGHDKMTVKEISYVDGEGEVGSSTYTFSNHNGRKDVASQAIGSVGGAEMNIITGFEMEENGNPVMLVDMNGEFMVSVINPEDYPDLVNGYNQIVQYSENDPDMIVYELDVLTRDRESVTVGISSYLEHSYLLTRYYTIDPESLKVIGVRSVYYSDIDEKLCNYVTEIAYDADAEDVDLSELVEKMKGTEQASLTIHYNGEEGTVYQLSKDLTNSISVVSNVTKSVYYNLYEDADLQKPINAIELKDDRELWAIGIDPAAEADNTEVLDGTAQDHMEVEPETEEKKK